jgi:DNA (cytosine-5)-methyltransferase 1
VPEDHFSKAMDADDLGRIQALRQGMTMKDLPTELWHASYQKRAYRRVMDGTPSEKRGGAPAGLRRLQGSEPSKAITSGARTEFIHPTEDRPLTLRECARLQTFPDDYRFLGSIADRALLIGNAVPPILGEELGRCVIRSIEMGKKVVGTCEGALLSFVPTVSEGTSPVLSHLIAMVEAQFGISQSQLCLVYS